MDNNGNHKGKKPSGKKKADNTDSKPEKRIDDDSSRLDFLEEKKDSKFDDLKNVLEEKKDSKFDDLKNVLEEKIDSRFDDLKNVLEEKIDSRFDDLKNVLESKKISELKDQNKKLEKELEEMETEKKSWQYEKKKLGDQRDQAQREKTGQESRNQKLEKELEEMKTEKKSWQADKKELEDAKTKLGVLTAQTEQAAADRKRWNAFTKDYQELMSFIYQCPSLQDIITRAAMEEEWEDADTMENMLKFIGVIGTGTSFAQDIYNVMRSYKKMNLQYLTEAERSFIIRLNQYYKKTLAVEFDVLDIPEEGKFESVCMQDIARPTAPYRNMSGVYVPGLRSDQKTFKQKAIVQGVKG